jgi:NADH dehydrogenase
MIFVTGATGFIGQALLRRLSENEQPFRILLRPSSKNPLLPRGVTVDAAVCNLTDFDGMRAALMGVDTVYHLAGSESQGVRGNLLLTDVQGTQTLCQAAAEAGVKRIFYVSHVGADRAAAYPLMKAKAIAEEHIRRSGVDYTILRTSAIFGQGDHFTIGLARLLNDFPFFFFVPGEGETLLQPLWVEDLATCLVWALDLPNTINQVISIGGPEFMNFNQVLEQVMQVTGIRRRLWHIHPGWLRWITVMLEHSYPRFPTTVYWLDYLATNRSSSLDTIPRLFNLSPSRFSHRLDYLRGRTWRIPWRIK